MLNECSLDASGTCADVSGTYASVVCPDVGQASAERSVIGLWFCRGHPERFSVRKSAVTPVSLDPTVFLATVFLVTVFLPRAFVVFGWDCGSRFFTVTTPECFLQTFRLRLA